MRKLLACLSLISLGILCSGFQTVVVKHKVASGSWSGIQGTQRVPAFGGSSCVLTGGASNNGFVSNVAVGDELIIFDISAPTVDTGGTAFGIVVTFKHP
jgi:hypothetical protein